jgi:hypothetical protein
MDETPAQQPLNKHPALGKATPDPNTDFGDEAFDGSAMPQKRISMGGINEWIFNKMRPKSKISTKAPQKEIRTINPHPDTVGFIKDTDRGFYVPEGYEIQNGILIQTKSLAERVRDQIKFPVLKSSQSLINGAALILFAIGATTLYSELPTRPELVIAILIVSISANIIISNR